MDGEREECEEVREFGGVQGPGEGKGGGGTGWGR